MPEYRLGSEGRGWTLHIVGRSPALSAGENMSTQNRKSKYANWRRVFKTSSLSEDDMESSRHGDQESFQYSHVNSFIETAL